MKPNPSHIPRDYMCITCEQKHRKCNHLDFTNMQVIGVFKDDGTREVKCTDYVKKEKLGGTMVTKVKDNMYNITLTEDEIYTLQILLGFVACDQECSSISEKLEEVSGECVDLEDYERVSFSVEDMDTGVVVGKMASDYDEATVVIRFN